MVHLCCATPSMVPPVKNPISDFRFWKDPERYALGVLCIPNPPTHRMGICCTLPRVMYNPSLKRSHPRSLHIEVSLANCVHICNWCSRLSVQTPFCCSSHTCVQQSCLFVIQLEPVLSQNNVGVQQVKWCLRYILVWLEVFTKSGTCCPFKIIRSTPIFRRSVWWCAISLWAAQWCPNSVRQIPSNSSGSKIHCATH